MRSCSTYGEEMRNAYTVLVEETSRKGNILKCVLKNRMESCVQDNSAGGRD